jgi:hypothetical protein
VGRPGVHLNRELHAGLDAGTFDSGVFFNFSPTALIGSPATLREMLRQVEQTNVDRRTRSGGTSRPRTSRSRYRPRSEEERIAMFVLVSPDSGHPDAKARAEVTDVQNLNQLHVEFHAVGDSPAADALAAAGLGTVEDGYAWLGISALRAAGEEAGGKDAGAWNDRFEAMLRYAQRNDWVDAGGTRVRAHIVRT